MNHLIGPCQSSFLQNRQSVDNAIILQEVVNHFEKMKGKKASFLTKIDLEKAFDRLEWSFICHTFQYFNFLGPTLKLLMSCICSTQTAILVNGTPTEYFSPMRGLRQGDQISPFIFILCVDVLSQQIELVFSNILWEPITISCYGQNFPHLFFADNLILMSQASATSCKTISYILKTFSTWSGQSISTQKLKLFFSDNCQSSAKRQV